MMRMIFCKRTIPILLIAAGLINLPLLAAKAGGADSSFIDSTQPINAQEEEFPAHNHTIRLSSNNIFRSLEVIVEGEVAFTGDHKGVKSISPGGYLMIKERRLFTTRRLQIRPGSDGDPEYRFTIRGRSMEYDDRARDWFSALLPELIRETALNAGQRVRELLAQGGVDAVLREIARVESSSSKVVFYQKLVEIGNPDADDQAGIVREAGSRINSGSSLRSLLSHLAVKLPSNPAVTAELFRAAGNISSGSEKAEALIDISRWRALDGKASIAMAQAIETISSSSEKSRALENMARRCASGEEVIQAFLKAAESIHSSTEKGEALSALIRKDDLSRRSWMAVADAAASIPSSVEKGRVLQLMAIHCPADAEVMQAFFRTAVSISSSIERAAAILAALSKGGLDNQTYIEAARAAATISSSSEKGNVLNKMAAVCPTSDEVLEAFLDTAFDIPSSAGKEEALVHLLEREGISQEVLVQILRRANEEISSNSARQQVVDMVSRRLRNG